MKQPGQDRTKRRARDCRIGARTKHWSTVAKTIKEKNNKETTASGWKWNCRNIRKELESERVESRSWQQSFGWCNRRTQIKRTEVETRSSSESKTTMANQSQQAKYAQVDSQFNTVGNHKQGNKWTKTTEQREQPEQHKPPAHMFFEQTSWSSSSWRLRCSSCSRAAFASASASCCLCSCSSRIRSRSRCCSSSSWRRRRSSSCSRSNRCASRALLACSSASFRRVSCSASRSSRSSSRRASASRRSISRRMRRRRSSSSRKRSLELRFPGEGSSAGTRGGAGEDACEEVWAAGAWGETTREESAGGDCGCDGEGTSTSPSSPVSDSSTSPNKESARGFLVPALGLAGNSPASSSSSEAKSRSIEDFLLFGAGLQLRFWLGLELRRLGRGSSASSLKSRGRPCTGPETPG